MTMLTEKTLAKRNRELVSQDYGHQWHIEQANITQGWEWGKPKPINLKTYDLRFAHIPRTHSEPRYNDD